MAKRGRKNSAAEKEDRILFILKLRSEGHKSTSVLFRFFSEKYDLTKRQFEYDLKEAKELIREHFEKDAEFEVSEITKHYWELYNKCFKDKQYKECRAVLKDISTLKGLIITKSEHTGKDGGELFGNVNLIIESTGKKLYRTEEEIEKKHIDKNK